MKANRFVRDQGGFSNLVPMVIAVVITFALIFVGSYVNGIIHEELADSVDLDDAQASMNNTSESWDSSLKIIQVVILITVLAAAIGAIMIFSRYR